MNTLIKRLLMSCLFILMNITYISCTLIGIVAGTTMDKAEKSSTIRGWEFTKLENYTICLRGIGLNKYHFFITRSLILSLKSVADANVRDVQRDKRPAIAPRKDCHYQWE